MVMPGRRRARRTAARSISAWAVMFSPVAARAIKEKRATFAATPGVDELRPRAACGYVGLGGGGIENLYLAGDWCDTGWPATMEGAVRSGYLAAAAGCVSDGSPVGRVLARYGHEKLFRVWSRPSAAEVYPYDIRRCSMQAPQ